MARREEFLFDAGVEAEDGGGVLPIFVDGGGGALAGLDGLLGVGERVPGFADLDDGAAAVPTIGREELLPEGVVDRKGGTMERAVSMTDTLVAGCAVLEVEEVGIVLELGPLSGGPGGLDGEVVLGAEVVEVVGLVDGLDVASESVEGFAAAVGVEKQSGDGG